MASTLFLLFALLFVGKCGARNAAAIYSSNAESNTFFGTTSLSERSFPYSRFDPDSLFSQNIPPTIKWKRVVSLANAIQVPSRQSLPNMWGEALLIAPYNESKRAIFHLPDQEMIRSALTNRTINRSHMHRQTLFARSIHINR